MEEARGFGCGGYNWTWIIIAIIIICLLCPGLFGGFGYSKC